MANPTMSASEARTKLKSMGCSDDDCNKLTQVAQSQGLDWSKLIAFVQKVIPLVPGIVTELLTLFGGNQPPVVP